MRNLAGKQALWLRRGLETHISLPVFGLVLLVSIWVGAFHVIDGERDLAGAVAAESLRELVDTYEAQMARSLGSIDQTLKVLKYAVEMKGAHGALPELDRQGLLPPGIVFGVSIVDRDGITVASNPAGPDGRAGLSVANEAYFTVHRRQDGGGIYAGAPVHDGPGTDARLHFSRRLNDADGHFAGVVVVATDPGYFTSSYERGRLGERGMLGAIGDDGIVRALRIGDKLSFGQHRDDIAPAVARTGAVEGLRPSRWDGVWRYCGLRQLRGMGLTVMVGLARDEQMASVERQRRDYLWEAGIASAVLVISVTLVWIWSWQGSKTRRRARRAQATYAAASEASLDAFFVLRAIYDDAGAIVDFRIAGANTRAEKMSGMSRQQLMLVTLCTLLPQLRDNGMFANLVRVATDGGVHEEEWENTMPHFRPRWLQQQVVGVDGSVVAILRDISERKQVEERILHMARHDTLTGLPNRSLIDDRLAQAIDQAQRRKSTVLVAFIDLDGFKLVNDGLGHNAGDELLKVVAGRMSERVRATDSVGRFGGDEFVLVLPEMSEEGGGAPAIIERIREAVIEAIVLGGKEVRVSCSIGVAMYPHDGADADTLLMNADAAMYRAKELGKNNCQFYTQEMNARIEEKLALLEGLRAALHEGQFRLLYQPKVDLRTGRIFGAEALVRWLHPQHGVIGPDRFIPLAEESGMIVALGEWVMQTACRQNLAWQRAGLAPLRVSVNVSARQFEDPRLAERVAQALSDSGLAAHWLELEVTESLIMRDLQRSVDTMRELKAMGVALSIDDFGTGYSSLSALKSFPIGTLKIDKSFVRDLANSVDDQAIASAIIALAHRLNMRVIAEGVETEQQRSFLRDNGCDEMQGYLFSRPIPAEQLQRMLESVALPAGASDAALPA
jgi:diguanylate cyclase (GGDEF)-like protein